MGISGLLPLLKSVQKPTHLSELEGKTIGVDAYVWLHRGAYACATELVTGKCTTRYVDYAMHRVRLLQYYRITPYVVFDGGHLPAKEATNAERKRKREKNMVLANTFAQQGKHLEAREYYAKCLDITPQMAFQLIKALRAENVSYVVAPYEADAQLVYLERTGVVDGILTEDSDMLIFGANLVLLKLDVPTATCTAISSDTLASNAPSDLPLYGWGVAELRACAMLSGCDYLEGVRGVGLKTAGKVMRRWGTIEKALRSLRMDGKRVDRDWEKRMRLAEAAFLHQRVWDARKKKVVYLSDPNLATWDGERERFVGRDIEPELAARLVRGDVDPFTFETMIDIMPSFKPSQGIHPRPLAPKDSNRGVSLHSVEDRKETKGPLFQYFAKQPKATTPTSTVMPLQRTSSAPARSMHVGGASGKRTLAEQYDLEAEKPIKFSRISENDAMCCSKFFSTPPSVLPAFDDDKENLEEFDHLDVASLDEIDVEIAVVEEEDRPLSPSPVVSSPESRRNATPDFSSPLQHRRNTPGPLQTRDGSMQKELRNSLEDKVDDVSDDGRITSPPSASKTPRASTEKAGLKVTIITQRDLRRHRSGFSAGEELLDVDLRDIFSESPTSKISEGRRTAASVKRVKFYTNTSSSSNSVVTKAKDRSARVLRRQETMRLPFGRSKTSTSQRANIVGRRSAEWIPPKTLSISCTVEHASDEYPPAATSSQRAVIDDPGT